MNSKEWWKPLKELKSFKFTDERPDLKQYIETTSEYVVTLNSSHLRIWSIETEKLIRVSNYNSNNCYPERFSISNDGQKIYIITDSNILRIIDIHSGNEINNVTLNIDYSDYFTISKDDKLLAVLKNDNDNDDIHTIYLFDNSNFELLKTLSTNIPCSAAYNCITFSSDSKYLAECHKVVNIWEVGSGKLINQLTHYASSVAFRPKGEYIYMISSDSMEQNEIDELKQENIKVWHVVQLNWNYSKTITEYRDIMDLVRPGIRPDDLRSVQFSPDGQYVVANYTSYIKIFNFETGEMLLKQACLSWNSSFTPDGKYICYCDDDGLKLFEFEF